MITKYITVSKETLAKIIILADQAQKLSEALESNNQELRILLHSLVKDSARGGLRGRTRERLLFLPKKKMGRPKNE